MRFMFVPWDFEHTRIRKALHVSVCTHAFYKHDMSTTTAKDLEYVLACQMCENRKETDIPTTSQNSASLFNTHSTVEN